jgi:3-phosphoshikimate 1-carboxyvinyltransferase
MKHLAEVSSLTISRPSRIEGRVCLPGSKSETNRLLLLGALCRKPFRIYNYSSSQDSQVFIDFLKGLGVRLELSENICTIYGCLLDSHFREFEIDLRDAGTGLRFLTAIAPFLDGAIVFRGSEQLTKRPILPLLQTLTEAGAKIDYLEKEGFLPYRITGEPRLQPQNFKLDTALSSQLLSGLLLLAPLLPKGFRIYVKGFDNASTAYVQMTLDILQAVGIVWKKFGSNCLELEKNQICVADYHVENDWTAASYWLGLASTLPAQVTLPNLRLSSRQGDARQVQFFTKWSLEITEWNKDIYIKNNLGNLVNSFDIDFSSTPDIAQTFAVLACFAKKKSRLTGLHALPYKETNRLEALVEELTRLGVEVNATRDSLEIYPAPILSDIYVKSHNDHRMAMSFALLANLVETVTIIDPKVVVKSYPGFWEDMEKVGYAINYHFD